MLLFHWYIVVLTNSFVICFDVDLHMLIFVLRLKLRQKHIWCTMCIQYFRRLLIQFVLSAGVEETKHLCCVSVNPSCIQKYWNNCQTKMPNYWRPLWHRL